MEVRFAVYRERCAILSTKNTFVTSGSEPFAVLQDLLIDVYVLGACCNVEHSVLEQSADSCTAALQQPVCCSMKPSAHSLIAVYIPVALSTELS
jgi:hypothetical protein